MHVDIFPYGQIQLSMSARALEYNYYVILLISFWCVDAYSDVFIENKIIEISLGDNVVNDSYFGYSLLLQKGSNPIVIVGSPKRDAENGGAVYACEISKYSDRNCFKYNMEASNMGTFSGNFLGSVLDGEANTGQSFVACAPKKVFEVGIKDPSYYLKGLCFYHENSSMVDSDVQLYPLNEEGFDAVGNNFRTLYYDNAFGQAGFDVKYIPRTGRVLMGAPGVKNWNGAMIYQSLSKFKDFQVIPRKKTYEVDENFDYLGYAVTYANIDNNLYEVAGAPRAANLFGMVKIYRGFRLIQQFKGDEMGGYFGSSILCYDVTNDGSDDLFVGVPMGAGTTFDEGYVYFYQNTKATKVKLYGSRNQGARFGTAISSLGDIDLDNYNDVAISAPFEDDGVGAVYIYMGEKMGIKITPTQRLTPSKFDGNFLNVRGFGLGLSKGNDIDGNGHNDLAVGAYKSGKVFVLSSKSVINFEMSLTTNVSSITDKPMAVKYCITYQQRSETKNLNSVMFLLSLRLDYRANGITHYKENVTVFLNRQFCKFLDVTIQQNVVDIRPFKIIMSNEVVGDIIATGDNRLEKDIPYSHGCGDDNVCQTKLALDVRSNSPVIVLGSTEQVEVTVFAENTGEPGYQCNLLIYTPHGLELRKRDCKSENGTSSCLISRKLVSTGTKTELTFDVVYLDPSTEEVELGFQLKCLGENLTPNEQLLSIAVITISTPYIEGKPDPENIYYDDNSVNDDNEISHTFTVGHSGPSPCRLTVYLLLPMVQYGGKEVFEFMEAQEDRNGFIVQCYPSNQTRLYETNYDFQSVLTEPLNRTILVDCFAEGSKCLEILCEGGFLEKSVVAKYTVKVKVKTSLLASNYRNQLQEKSIIAYVASAFLSNSTTRIENHSATLIFSSHSKSVPIWVWIVAAVLGILLLAVFIVILHKCHFFDRRYRDKLQGERLMDHQTAEMESVPNST